MVVVAAVASRNTSRSGSRSSWPANQASRAALTSPAPAQPRASPFFAADAMAREEAREAAGADLDPVLLECVAQLAQEDLRPGFIGLQDQRGMSLNAVRALVSALGLGREATLLSEALVPADGRGQADAEALGGLAARGALFGLASLQWRAFGGLCGPPFELHRAEEVERGVAPDGVVESLDVTADGVCSLGPGLEDGAPDELGFQRLEERLHHGIVETVAPARHGNPEAVRPELGLIRRRAILAASVGVVDQPGAGRRRASALRSAVSAKSVWRRSLTAQPTP